jgi:hypothetical protein
MNEALRLASFMCVLNVILRKAIYYILFCKQTSEEKFITEVWTKLVTYGASCHKLGTSCYISMSSSIAKLKLSMCRS